MSKSGDSIEDTRYQTSSDRRGNLNMVRRMVVTLTREVFWTLTGVKQLDGFTSETKEAEPFLNAGFFSRPPVGTNHEAIVVFLGGSAENPMIIATRDEDTRRVVCKDIGQGDTTMFNGATRVVCRQAGTIELRKAQDVAAPPLEATLRAESFRAALTTLLSAQTTLNTALSTFASTCTTLPAGTAAALATAIATYAAAVASFNAAWASYLSGVVKLQ